MVTVALYARISFDRTGEAVGTDRQLAECETYAAERGWTVGRIYRDDSISATSGRVRPAFEQLLADAPPVVVVWHTDRLVRLTRDLERVIDAGLVVHAVHAGHLDLSTTTGRAVARTVTAWATYEGEHKAERMRAAHRDMAERGITRWVHIPFGYNADRTLHPEQSAVMAETYRAVLRGTSLAQAARDLNNGGHRTATGREWTPTNLRQALLSPLRAGDAVHAGAVVARDVLPATVDRVTFDAVGALLRNPARRTNRANTARKHLLSNLALCGACGERYVLAGKGNGKDRYRCRCGRLGRLLQDADDAVIEAVLRTLSLDTTGAVVDVEDTTEQRARVAELEALRAEWLQSGMRPSDVATALAPIDAELEALSEGLADAERSRLGAVAAAESWEAAQAAGRDAWDELPLVERRRLVSSLFDVRVLRGRGAVVELTPTPLAERIFAAQGPEARDWALSI